MDPNSLAPLFDWLATHRGVTGLLVALVAFFESLAVVGLFLPGVVLMFGIGALVGAGALDLWPTLAWAAAGAVAGDSVSFWLGRHFHQRLRIIWPLRTHPELLARATDFFHHHGGKSVFLGRFIGPIRPIIPAVAGMLEMPTGRFLVVNLLSALLWAPLYTLPGMVFAASLGVAAEVAGRLALLLVLLLTLLVMVLWVTRRLYRLFHRRAHRVLLLLLGWSRRHPLLGEVPAALLDPEHSEARGLTLLAGLLILASITFLLLLRGIAGDGVLHPLDGYLHHLLQSLRVPAMDHVMVLVTRLGEPSVLLLLFLVMLGWLVVQRRWHAVAHWGAAALFALLLTYLLQWLAGSPVPPPGHPEGRPFTLLSLHTIYATAVYGFLAVLLGREVRSHHRWWLYGVVAALVAAIAFSRLYLGAHWPSSILAGLALGVAWVTLLGIAYRRHPAAALSPRGISLLAGVTLLSASAWNGGMDHHEMVERYTTHRTVTTLSAAEWWAGGWRDLPAYRNDLRGHKNHPLTVQYAGPLTELDALLAERDWESPPPLTATSWLRWLTPKTPLRTRPLLPQVHDGRNEALLRVLPVPDGQALLVLRLWPSDHVMMPDGSPIWIGNVGRVTDERLLWFLTVPQTGSTFATPLETLAETVASLPVQRISRGGAPLLLIR